MGQVYALQKYLNFTCPLDIVTVFFNEEEMDESEDRMDVKMLQEAAVIKESQYKTIRNDLYTLLFDIGRVYALRHYHAQHKHREELRSEYNLLTPEALTLTQNMFYLFDRDNAGLLDMWDFFTIFNLCDTPKSVVEMGNIFKTIDTDKDGWIDIHQFLPFIYKYNSPRDPKEMNRAVKLLNKWAYSIKLLKSIPANEYIVLGIL